MKDLFDLDEYMQKTFPGLQLRPSLYFQWETRLHFELGEDIYQFDQNGGLNRLRFKTVYAQATTIFNEIFSREDDMVLVTNVYKMKGSKDKNRPFKVYKRGLKNKELLYQLNVRHRSYLLDEEEEDEMYTAQYHLKCRTRDLNSCYLIQAACNEDFPLKPNFCSGKKLNYPDVFFINLTKNVIFFIYDDRGCEVIAANREILRPLYEKHQEWMDEHSLEDAQKLFI